MILRLLGVLVLAIGAAGALQRWVVEPVRCSHAASRGSVLLDSLDRAADTRKQAAAARVRKRLGHCENSCPPDVGIPFTQGGAEEMAGDDPAAIRSYQRALQIDRRPEIYFRLGLAQLGALDRAGGLESLTRACTFDPKLINEIPYEDVRDEVRNRIRAKYGEGW